MSITDKQKENSERRARSLANLKPFKPGESGNRKGRPKKEATLSDAYRAELAKPAPNDALGRTNAQVIAAKMVGRAVMGDLSAARELGDRAEGKPAQIVDQATLDRIDRLEKLLTNREGAGRWD